MFDEFQHACEFVCIYILEAHAVDEWPIRTKSELCIKQHQTLHDRCELANSLVNPNQYQFQMPVFVDTMDNSFQTTYAGWPLRVFIFQNSTIQFILEPKRPGYFDLKDLSSELSRRFSHSPSSF